jgi:hypothetical protein
LWSGPRLAFTRRRGPLIWIEPTYQAVEKISTLGLFAPDDLADPRVIKADKFADVSQREPSLLRLRECLAPCLSGGLAVALKLLLGSFHGFGGGFALGVVGH